MSTASFGRPLKETSLLTRETRGSPLETGTGSPFGLVQGSLMAGRELTACSMSARSTLGLSTRGLRPPLGDNSCTRSLPPHLACSRYRKVNNHI